MKISLKDDHPVQLNYNSVPRHLYSELKMYIEDLLNKQWIVNSSSSYSSPVVAVRKKDGTMRLCCDYRKLNAKTVPDRHPLPCIQNIIDRLGGNQYFTLLDQSKAYHQLHLHPDSQKLTAFITPWGFYKWLRVPLGLMNAPAAFQRFMEHCLGDFRNNFAVPYLDDLLIFSKSFDEHLQHFQQALQRLKKHGIKIKPSKCKFFNREVSYLGRLMSAEGYNLNPKSVELITSKIRKKPNNISELYSLLGLVGYVRRSIPNFSQLVKPLYLLLKDKDLKRGSKQLIEWTADNQSIMDKLLTCLTEPPILAYPNFSVPFILHTDVSSAGLGCGLFQEQDGTIRVIGYGSRTLVGSEEKYHSSKLEFLALKWTVCDHFRDYLFYAPEFHVYTDYNPLTYIKTSSKVNATGQRWINELANFNFSIHYKPGEQNVADALSRFPIEKEYCRDQYSKTCSSVEVKSIFDGAINQQHDNETWIAAVNVTSNSFDDIQTEILYGEGNNKCSISKDDIVKAQEEENWIKTVKDTIGNKNSLDKETISSNSFQLKGLVREFKHLLVGTDNILLQKN